MPAIPVLVASTFLIASLATAAYPKGATTTAALNPVYRELGQKQAEQNWAARGGTLTVSLNTALLQELHITLGADGMRQAEESSLFPLSITDSARIEFSAPQGNFDHFTGGALQSGGRFEWTYAGKSKSFAGFTTRAKSGTARDLEILDRDGVAWFVSDHVHYELLQDKTRLSMRNMDLRLTRTAALWLGDGTLTGLAVGSMAFDAQIVASAPINLPQSCANPNWAGTLLDPANPVAGTYQTDVLLESMASLDYKRCAGTCDGPEGDSDGFAIFAPNATLKNSDTDSTSDVPWNEKFSGSFAPYNNDQHPFLVWNIYRISDTGQIEHIARSGVKHAYLTINDGCTVQCGDNHILGRSCGDVYSSGNNDAATALGSRSEIVPALGLWARCGSIYDSNCDGVNDSPVLSPTSNRLMVPESKISDPLHYQYFYEAWYVVRDDINIKNTMGSKQFTPRYGLIWSATDEQPFISGPVIDRWVDPSNPGVGNLSAEVTLINGSLKVAVRTQLLPSGNTRYDYAVMNLDYLSATLEVIDSLNTRLLDSAGISGFSVPSNQALISNILVNDGDDAITDWAEGRGGSVHFRARSPASELKWSSLYSFSFEANTAPVAGKVALSGRGLSEDLQVDLLVPGLDPNNLLIDDFE